MTPDRRRDRYLRIAGTVLACAILGPPFAIACAVAAWKLGGGAR